MPRMEDPERLLQAARGLLRAAGAQARGASSRAASHLTRQALELGLDRFWLQKEPKLAQASQRSQFICLPQYVSEKVVARRAWWTWCALSEACHHHVYELAPTGAEVERWIGDTEALLIALGQMPDLKAESA